MAKADRKHAGPAAQGKGAGVGALTDLPADKVPENGILSNRDKQQHSKERGLDGKRIESAQHGDEV